MRPGTRELPRRRRRGLSLAEAAAALGIAALTLTLIIETVRGHFRGVAAQAEARALSESADLARRYAAHDFMNLSERLRRASGRTEIITEADLTAAGFNEPGRPMRTPRGRRINVAAWLPTARAGEERVALVVWAAAPAGWKGIATPRIEEGTRLVGRIGSGTDGCRARHVCGPGIDWDASRLIADLGAAAPAAGDLTALRLLHPAADAEPFLHRRTVAGRPDLNRVEGVFVMNGGSLRDVPELAADSLRLENSLTVTGDITAADAELAADISTDGAEAGSAIVSGPAISAGGRVDASVLAVNGTIEARTWTSGATFLEGVLAAGALTVSGDLEISADADTGVLSGGRVTAATVAGLPDLRADTAAAAEAEAGDVTLAATGSGYIGALCVGCRPDPGRPQPGPVE